MKDQKYGELGHGGDDGSVITVVHDDIVRATRWSLAKRDASIEDYVDARIDEAREVADGHRGSHLLLGKSGGAFMEALEGLEYWKTGIDPDSQDLWTPDRMVKEALRQRFLAEVDPYEVIEREGNILVTVGIDILLDLLIGAGGTVFSNANAHLGVGDSSTAAAVGQTDLQAATNKLRKAMNGGYPAVSAPTIDFQSTFGSSEANFSWNEVGTFNAAAAGIMLNRKVQSLGTKTSGATWTLTETITWS